MRRLLFIAAFFVLGCNLSDPEQNNGRNNQNNSNNVNNVDDTGTDTTVRDMAPDMRREDVGTDVAVDMGPEPITLDDFCTARGLAYARELYACYSSGPYFASYYDPNAPDAALRWGGDCWAQQAYIDAGTIVYDPVEAGRCAEAMAELDDGTCYFGNEPHRVLDACQGVITPVQNEGEACYIPSECVQGYCDAPGGACPRACVNFAQVGEACDTVNCDNAVASCVAGICRARGIGGEVCADNGECLNYLCVNNVCVDSVEFGEACDAANPCTLSEVQNGDTLVQQCNNGMCTFKAAMGESCLYDYTCPVGTYCERPNLLGPGTCDPLPTLGQPCANGFLCAADLYCFAGTTCEPAAQVNELCNTVPCAGDGSTLFCSPRDNRCHPQGIRGALCDPNRSDSCTPGLICQPATTTCGDSAADGQACRPYGYGYNVGYNAPFTLPCQAGSACRCDPAQPCTQGNNNDPHLCTPFTPPAGSVVCTSANDCASNEFCLQSNDGLAICTPGACQLR